MPHGKFILPKNHKPFMKVAKGGSNCGNCKFLTSDKKHCGNKYFVTWYGTDLLPTPVSRYCSDWYEPNPEYLKSGGVITPDLSGKPIEPINSERFAKKREHAEQLANSIRSLRGALTKDMKSEDEKVRLTALVIAIIDKTAERVGNEDSAERGHFGVTMFRLKHVTISRNTVTLNYKGKSGVVHEKSFTDALIASTLAQAIKDTPKRSIFVTSDGFRIKADRVNRYLSEYNISAKDLRGYHANKYIIDKLHKQEIPTEIKDRKVVFKKAVRYSAARVGHAPMTLQKHYLFPELQVEYVNYGKIINLSDFYSGGGAVAVREDSGIIKGPSHLNGGIPMVVKPANVPIEVEGKEYYLCKSVLSDPHVYEFHDATNREVLDAIFQMEGCKYNPKVAHNDDFIVCKLATQDKKVRDRVGTIPSILNSMQGEYGCKLTSDGTEFLFGGRVGIGEYSLISDELYYWKLSDLMVYSLYKRNETIKLYDLIEHPELFGLAPLMKDIRVSFNNANENSGIVEDLEKIFVSKNLSETVINLTLNFSYYEQSKTEFRTIESNEPDLAKESILLHEIQHVLQAIYNRSSGTGTISASIEADARMDALRHKRVLGILKGKEEQEFDFYNSLTEEDVRLFFYIYNSGEREARKVVRIWLASKGIEYVDPLKELFGIDILEDGGGINPVVDINWDVVVLDMDDKFDINEDLIIFTSPNGQENLTDMQTEPEFKAAYIEQLKIVSPGQPDSWYEFQADENWKRKLKQQLVVLESKSGINNPDYKLSFEDYLVKHNVKDLKRGLAEKQWIKSIKEANDRGLYEVALLDGSMDAVTVEDRLTAAVIPISADIKKIIREEYDLMKAQHKSESEQHKSEMDQIKAETVIRAKEIKKIYTKQELIDTIAGLRVLAEDKTGKEKDDLIATIEGLEILIETMPETLEVGGYALYKDGNIIHETYI